MPNLNQRKERRPETGGDINMTKTKFYLIVTLVFVTSVFMQRLAHAQDAVDVQQDIDIQTVNSKAEDAKGKANSLELRVTNLEALPTIDPTLEARVVALETAPPPTEYDDTLLAARVTALENQQTTVPKWVARDSLGTFVASWFDRAAVGVAFVDTFVGEIQVSVEPDRIRWIGVRPVASAPRVYSTQGCGWDGLPAYIPSSKWSPPDLSNDGFFGGIVEGELVDNPDGSTSVWHVQPDITITLAQSYVRSLDGAGNPTCLVGPKNILVKEVVFGYDLPTFVGPFTIAQEQ